MERVVNKKEDIITLRIDHSDWSMNRIAKEVGCSREYVRLVLLEVGLPTAVGNWAKGNMKYHERKTEKDLTLTKA